MPNNNQRHDDLPPASRPNFRTESMFIPAPVPTPITSLIGDPHSVTREMVDDYHTQYTLSGSSISLTGSTGANQSDQDSTLYGLKYLATAPILKVKTPEVNKNVPKFFDKSTMKQIKIVEVSSTVTTPSRLKSFNSKELMKRAVFLKQIVSTYKRAHEVPEAEHFVNELKKIRQILSDKSIIKLFYIPKYDISTFWTLVNNKGWTNPDNKQMYLNCIERLKEKLFTKRNIKTARKAQKLYFHDHPLSRYGYVHEKPNQILNIFKEHESFVIDNDKHPSKNGNSVGVEIEFNIRGYSYVHLRKAFIEAKLSRFVKFKNDGSLRTDSQLGKYKGPATEESYELTIVAEEHEINRIIKETCEILKQYSCYVNDSCGLHVHLDMRNRNKKLVFYNLVKMQDFLFSIVKKERKQNQYCIPVSSPIWNENDVSHYHAINSKDAFSKHKTIEIRMHQGSIDPDEINNWINLLLKIAHKTEVIPKEKQIVTLTDFKSLVKLDSTLNMFYAKRINKKSEVVSEPLIIPLLNMESSLNSLREIYQEAYPFTELEDNDDYNDEEGEDECLDEEVPF